VRARSVRLPLEPLVRRHGSVSALARALGVERARAGAWWRRGVSIDTADRIAVSLGLHPVEVWPGWFALCGGDVEAA
jgi:plasmid maintenance system antidote protein VapI